MEFKKIWIGEARNMNLVKKLLISFLSVILFLVINSGITYYQFYSIENGYSTMIDDRTKKIELATKAIMEAKNGQLVIRGYLFTGNEKELNNYYDARDNFAQYIEEILAISKQDEAKEIINRMVAVEEAYHQVAEKLINLKRAKKMEEVMNLMNTEAAEINRELEATANELFAFQQKNIEISSTQLADETRTTTLFILMISLVSIIIAITIAIFISRNISNRLNPLTVYSEKIAEGDLSIEEINVKGKDEIAQLAESFNKMLINLKNIIHQVDQTSGQLAASSEELLATSQETTASTNQVATTISEMAKNIKYQDDLIQESGQAILAIVKGITQIANNVNIVASSATETSQQANQGSRNMENVVEQMNHIYDATVNSNQVITELEKRSSEIEKIIEVITEIAEQTNLLALNAAIESARAGEHGKGFAVVADEVRKLAEQSRSFANQIGEIIKFIQSDTMMAAELMKKGLEQVTSGRKVAEETGEMFKQILNSIEHVNAQTQELSAISKEISAGAEQVNIGASKVMELSKVNSASTDEISIVTEEQLAASEEVSSSASSLAHLAEEMRKMVGKFKM